MYKVWMKSVMVPLLGLAAFGLSQTAAADWDSGRCPNPNSGPAPCIEHQDSNGNWWHFNGDGDHAGVWHGYPTNEDGQDPEEPFTFCGETDLSCTVPLLGEVNLTCNLCLDGNVQKFQDGNGDWLIGVQVTGGTVTPGESGCNNISLGGFPWYAGDTGTHQGFGSTTGVPYTGAAPYTGNFGGIDITYLGFYTLASNGHVHGVDFLNNGSGNTASQFAFGTSSIGGDETIYEGGNSDDDSGCTVSGLLAVQSPAQDINIW